MSATVEGSQTGCCQAQLEELLLGLGVKQAKRLYTFALEYAGRLAYSNQVLSMPLHECAT